MVFRKIRVGAASVQRGLAFVTAACGFLMMWGSSGSSFQSGTINVALQSQVIEIDSLVPSGVHNQSLVVAAGKFVSPETLEDEFLKPARFLIMRRHVEMFQWQEITSPISGAIEYSLDWHEGQVDFFRFKQTSGHENPLLRYEGFTRRVNVSTFGAFEGSALLKSVQSLIPLTLAKEMLKDPSLRIENNAIIVPRQPDSQGGETPQLGDMRVWYEVLPEGNYTVLTRQVDERNLIGAESGHAMVLRPGLLSAEELFAAEARDSERVVTGLLYLGGILFFLGLYSTLVPFAGRFTLRPKINLQGAPALALVCAAVSIVAVMVFFIVGQVAR